jgi:hypothetical protein
MAITFFAGILGIVGLAAFLGIMLFKVPALPLILICGGVMLLLVWDFVNELRAGAAKSRR